MENKKILIVEDDRSMAALLKKGLEEENQVVSAAMATAALQPGGAPAVSPYTIQSGVARVD